ncbi:DNA translocase SpoIIIE [termite gut metagenome]|uniref:DNA translocase SpoIIIE n=1 Tax=termite gut metagenome TaxID=433724 RepID=A0A5J4S2U8_9ZZZZ
MAKGNTRHTKKSTDTSAGSLKTFFTGNTTHYITGLILLMLAIYASFALISFLFTGAADQSRIEGLSLFYFGSVDGITNWTGTRGAILSSLLMNDGFGVSTLFLLLFVVFIALRLMKARYFNLFRNFIICTLLTIWSSVTLSFFFGSFFADTALYIGGKHGLIISKSLINDIGLPGTFLLLLFVFIVLMAVLNANTIPFLQNLTKRSPRESRTEAQKVFTNVPEPDTDEDDEEEVDILIKPDAVPMAETPEEFVIEVPPDEPYTPQPQSGRPSFVPPVDHNNRQQDSEEDISSDLVQQFGLYDPTLELAHYELPSLDLLQKYDLGNTQVNDEEQRDNKTRIKQTLANYNIEIKTIKATVGPTITLYEIVPQDGVRISKIRNLEADIALSLAAIGIRIIAPMPGKGTIGI